MADNAESSNHLCRSGDHHGENDCSNHGEEDTDFLPFRHGCNGIPVNWTRVPSLLQEHYILEELNPGQPEYDKIVAEFSRRKLRVVRIERLQNMRLLEQFKSEEEDVKKESRNDSMLKICYLYHRTNLEKKHICEKGLDQSIMTRGNKGPGLYFSKDPRNCIPFSRHRDGPDETMILKSRVILDDWQDSPEDLEEYVVHEHRRVMVEYLIFCKLDSEQLSDGEGWRSLVMFVIFLIVGYFLTPFLIRMVLWVLGFTAQGVKKDSTAAKWQSFIGVTRGSWFATAQSVATTGVVNECTRIIVSLLIGAIIWLFYQW